MTITDEALEAAVHLSARYINDRFLPDKAIDLIDEACSKVRLSSYTSSPKVKELEKKVAELEEEKEQAIKDEAYERASEIKKMQKELNDEMIRLNSEWEKVRSSEQLIVGENEVADIVASWTKIPVRSRKCSVQSHPTWQSRSERSEAPDWFILVPGTYRCRQNGIVQGTGRGNVRQGGCHDPG